MRIRPWQASDHEPALSLIREAFWNLYTPGAREHLEAHQLIGSEDFLPELSRAIDDGDRLIGCLLASRSTVRTADGTRHETLTFGPVVIHPAYQKRGLGSELITDFLSAATETSAQAVIILGYPCYYRRLGFKNAHAFGLSMPDGSYPMGLLVHPLKTPCPSGTFHPSSSFEASDEDLNDFETRFPPRRKAITISQKIFSQVLALKHDDPEPENLARLSCDRRPLDEVKPPTP